MNFFRSLPVIFSFLLLAAHFYRGGEPAWLVLSLLLPLLLLVRKAWVPPVIQAALVVGALEWVLTAWAIAQFRVQLGMPWLRMALILGAVALVTLLSALVFRLPRLRAVYGAGGTRPATAQEEVSG